MYIRNVEHPREDEDRRFWTKMLPFGMFINVIWSSVPFLIGFISFLKNTFAGVGAIGATFVSICSAAFLVVYIIVFKSCEEERYTHYPVH